MLDCLATIPKNPEAKPPASREWVIHELVWAFRRGITAESVAHLIARGQKDEELRDTIAWMLDDVDHPDAVEYVVRQMAKSGTIHLGKNLTSIGDNDPELHPLSINPSFA